MSSLCEFHEAIGCRMEHGDISSCSYDCKGGDHSSGFIYEETPIPSAKGEHLLHKDSFSATH